MTTKLTFAACLTVGLAIFSNTNLSAQTNTSAPFNWLEGSWLMKEGNSEFHERWSKSADNSLTGTGFMLVKGDTVMRELIKIEKIGKHWVYIAAIDKSEPTLFTLKETKDNTYTFENKEHSFPQRIVYQQKPDGSLNAWIEGKVLGKIRKEEFPMQKVK